MKILVNAIPLSGLLTGIARYVRNLYTCLENEPDVIAEYYTGRQAVPDMPVQNGHESWIIKNNRFRRLPDPAIFAIRSAHWLAHEHFLRKNCRKQKYNLYHETGFIPARVPDLPVVYTLYDLSLRRYAHTHPRERVLFFEFFIKRRLPAAAHVLTISNFIKDEIIDEFKLPADKVTAVSLAPDPHFSTRSRAQIKDALSRLGIPEDYILFTGTLEPRKNINLIIDALPLMKHKISLVLAGWSGWGDKKWKDELASRGLLKRVIQPGYVSEEDLACLYSGAKAFVYPSLYEGFGLPVLEAMACGCPVITSKASCLPETAGEAAILTDPHDPQQLADYLNRLIEDDELSRSLVRKGLDHSSSFTWQKTAMETLEVFKKTG